MFWKNERELLRQARAWSLPLIDAVQPELLAADRACKSTGSPDRLIAERLALTIAGRARRLRTLSSKAWRAREFDPPCRARSPTRIRLSPPNSPQRQFRRRDFEFIREFIALASAQAPANLVELLQGGVTHPHLALTAPIENRHLQPKHLGQVVLQRRGIGVLADGGGGGRARASPPAALRARASASRTLNPPSIT